MSRYNYYFTGDTIICVSHYAGKSIRGVAKCAPADEYDEEFGKKLARLRCDVKVAEQRYKRANQVYDEAVMEAARADAKLDRRNDYLNSAEADLDDANYELEEFYVKNHVYD